MSENLGLYLHIPFCKRKCAYCDFYSLSGCGDFKRYTDALLLHMQDYADAAGSRTVDSVYIGGGTPSILPTGLMLDLLCGIKKNFHVSADCEFTIEANPATVSASALKKYTKNGLNRLSIGMQSADDGELRTLGRIHSYADFEKSFLAARRVGIENINVDVMYGIPGQSPESLANTLEKLFELSPEHISLYGLKIEEGTPFYNIKDSLELPDEDAEFSMYSDSVSMLEEHGYRQYEISNFAKDGYRCRHNLKYWRCEEYLGLGPGAHSYFNGSRFSFKKDLVLYVNSLEHIYSNIDITDENYEIAPSERRGEYIMLSLRLCDGIDVGDFKDRFHADFEKMYERELSLYLKGGFMKKTDRGYAFTVKGMFVSNYILSDMLDFDSGIIRGAADGSDRA